MLGSRKRKTIDFSVKQVVRNAMSIKLDISKVCPANIHEWIKVVAKARNTVPEFVLLGAIPTTAALMGPTSSVRVRSTYCEPINVYSLVLSPPGAGKSQAFDLTVTSPLASLDDPPPDIVVGDHTRSGLTRHLANNGGVAIIASDELSTFLDGLCQKKKEDVEERAFLNKLYDRREDMGPYTYEYGNSRLEIRESRVCIAGFSQDEEFVRQFSNLQSRKDGFLDRLLFAVPEPHLLTNREVDYWAKKLYNFPITDFSDVYQEIWEVHMHDDSIAHEYTLSTEARQEYTVYADEIIRKLNLQFTSSSSTEDSEDIEEVSSKDGRTVLRLAGALHVLYAILNKALTKVDWRQEEERGLPAEISLSTIKFAMALTDYYKSQRNVFVEAAKGQLQPKALHGQSLKAKIMTHPGPCITVRNVTRAIPCNQRPSASDVLEAMQDLEQNHAGLIVDGPHKIKVFLKRKRSELEEDAVAAELFKTTITADLYERQFNTRDDKLSNPLFGKLLRQHPNEEEIKEIFSIK